MAKYKIVRGFNAPNPIDHKEMPFVVLKKKLFGDWLWETQFEKPQYSDPEAAAKAYIRKKTGEEHPDYYGDNINEQS